MRIQIETEKLFSEKLEWGRLFPTAVSEKKRLKVMKGEPIFPKTDFKEIPEFLRLYINNFKHPI